MTKKVIAFFASCVLSSSSVMFISVENTCSASYEIMMGKCGQDAEWSFNDETGLLLIKGSGAMTDYSFPSDSNNPARLSPWHELNEKITSICIEEGISHIGNSAFTGCTSLKSASLPDTMLSIGDNSFYGCTSIESVNIPANVITISNRAFLDCTSLKEISFPPSLNSIGIASFYNCSSLVKAEFSEGLKELYDKAFSNCESLTSVTLPKSLTYIADDALGLKLIPDGDMYDYIKYENFRINGYERSAAQKYAKDWGFPFNIIDPQPVIPEFAEGSCGNGITWEFSKDNGTLSIKGSGNIPDYSSKDAIPPWQDLSSAITSVEIGDNVAAIGAYSFKGMDKLRNVVLPDTLQTIGKAAFAECILLETADIPESVRTIEDSAFSDCENLKELKLKEGIKNIGTYSFSGCSSLSSVELPSGIQNIGDEAFINCRSLNNIVIPETAENIGDHSFGYLYSDGTYLTYSNKTAIYGSSSSAAERYASENNITFISTDTDISTTVCTTTIVTTSSTALKENFTDDQLCSWAVNDYQNKTSLTEITASILSASADEYKIALYDKEGNLIDTYIIDPSTGIGTDSKGYTVDLPQTGRNSVKDMIVLIAAMFLIASGTAVIKLSGCSRRKGSEQ